jgi:hypothetical protein
MFLGGSTRYFTDDYMPEYNTVGFHGHYDRMGRLNANLSRIHLVREENGLPGDRARPVLVHGDRLNSALCVAGTDCGLGGRVHAALMQGVVLSEN